MEDLKEEGSEREEEEDEEVQDPEPVGNAIATAKGRIFYDAVQWNKSIIRRNSVVFLQAEPKPYLGYVVELFQKIKNKKMAANIRWFFRWADIEHDLSHLSRPRYEHEVFLGMAEDINDVETIIRNKKIDNIFIYEHEVFLGMTEDINDVETIIGPCDFHWVIGCSSGGAEMREVEKDLLEKKKKYFCSHLYDGSRFIPIFDSKIRQFVKPKMLYEQILELRENISDISDWDDDDVEELIEQDEESEKKTKVKGERKRKKSSSSISELQEKRRKIKQEDPKELTFENVCDITLTRKEVLQWQQCPDSILLIDFFVRVPVQRETSKTYLLAQIEDISGLEEEEKHEGYTLKKGLKLKIPEVGDLIRSGIQHVSSFPLLDEEFSFFQKSSQLPTYSTYMEKLKHKNLLQQVTQNMK